MIHRITYIFMLLLLVSSCGKKAGNGSDNEGGIDSVMVSHDTKVSVLKELYYSEDITTPPTDRVLEMKNALLSNMDKLIPTDAIHCLYFLEGCVEGELFSVSEREASFLEAYSNAMYDQKENGIAPQDSILQKEKHYKEMGLEIVYTGEGNYEISAGEKFYEEIVKHLPEEYREIWSLSLKSRTFFNDAGVMVSWKELGELLAKYEAYATKNKDLFEVIVTMSRSYALVQAAYIYGLDNSPITEFENNGQLNPEVKAEYERFVGSYPDSPTASLVRILLAEPKITEETFEKVKKARQELTYPLLTADMMQYNEE
ncbi:hypothetical protein [Porphyromonas canoris]|uniref:hypothetical protein n=1 Tax=Porphyromonas canoris TaxID=36875 RepID=UPI00126A477A|nr:hypothetical protein [Porphyromonas canoris]